MRRQAGVIATAALAAALLPRIAFAAAPAATLSPVDLPTQLFARVFGESSDGSASLAAAYGDRLGESPLRDLALRAGPAQRPPAFEREAAAGPTFAAERSARLAASAGTSFDFAQSARAAILRSNLRFAASPPSDDTSEVRSGALSHPAATFTAGSYQPVAPVTLVSPQSGAFSLGGLVHGAPPAVAASSALAFGETGTLPGAAGSSEAVPSAVRLGPLKFTTRLEGGSVAAPSVGLNDNAAGAGANLDVRAGARTLTFGLSSDYERLTRNDSSGLTPAALGASSSWQLPGSGVPLAVPNYADMSKLSVGAGVAVPVLSGLTLNLDYAADRMFGGYGLPGLSNLDSFDNSYGGKLTFEIPHSSSTLSISARQLRYQDGLIPVNASTETREDVNFTVKF